MAKLGKIYKHFINSEWVQVSYSIGYVKAREDKVIEPT